MWVIRLGDGTAKMVVSGRGQGKSGALVPSLCSLPPPAHLEPGDTRRQPQHACRIPPHDVAEVVNTEVEPAPTNRQHEERRAQHRSEEHTSELQSQSNLVCRLLLEKKK